MAINGLSGDELFCLAQKNYQAKDIIIGNSIYSLGHIQNLCSGIHKTVGKEFKEATKLLAEGRAMAHKRMVESLREDRGLGVVKVKNEIIYYAGLIEFYSSGSLISTTENQANLFFTSADGQEFYALLDAGYQAINIVFGNIVYATNHYSGLFTSLKNLTRGEIPKYTEILRHTHQIALERLINDAKKYQANVILSIKITFSPFKNAKEMSLIGSACNSSQFISQNHAIITSNLSNIEMWNLAKLGYIPLQMLMSSVVFSLGINSNLNAAIKSILGHENTALTKMISHCRELVIYDLNHQAKKLGAEMVTGVQIYINQLGNGLIEFFAVGTAVKKSSLAKTKSSQLLVQALASDKYKLNDYTDANINVKENTAIFSLLRILVVFIIIIALVWLAK